jgi:two-component system, NarL family, sensor histidine kinase UhpB
VAATSLFRRQTRHRATLLRGLFARSAALLTVATLVLILAPISISVPIKTWQLEALLGGLAVLLIASLLLLRQALRPLETLAKTMRSIDPLAPGQRVDAEAGPEEVETLAGAFNDMLDRLEDERRESARRSLAAQEEERRRIARELHDEIGQTLTGLLLRTEALLRRAPAELRPDLEDLRDVARQGAEDARGIARRLRPEALDELGLAPALQGLADRTPLAVETDLDPAVELDAEEELVVYRVAQESLTNVVRHSGSTRARLRLQHTENGVTLTVADEGIGLGGGEGGAGIRGMRERALLIGARLTIEPVDPRGLEVRLEIAR